MFDPRTLSIPLCASASHRGDAVVLILDGELDLSARVAFEELLDEAVESDAEHVFVDLRGLQFIDSTGIALLLHAMKIADEQGFAIRFVPGDGHVWSVLKTTGVADRIPIADEQELRSRPD
jgi:anti-sigma B factor antagonist